MFDFLHNTFETEGLLNPGTSESVIKKQLGNNWNNVYDKFGLITYNQMKGLNFFYIIKLKEDYNTFKKNLNEVYGSFNRDLNDNKYKRSQKSWKNFKKKRAYSYLIILIKYESITGKKIIPEDIKVPQKLYEIAEKIDLDL